MIEPCSVLITGASSGLGRALALLLAAPGVALHLSGRNSARLEAVAEACRERGALVGTNILDVGDAAAMEAWISAVGRLDLVVANAGISAGTGRGQPESEGQTRAILAANLDGVMNTVLPAIAAMRLQVPSAERVRGSRADGVRGRIAVVASIAAFVPAPGAPAYCASKAAVDAWAVAAAESLLREGIIVTSICPGYVRTAMTERNRFPMPGLMDADRAARIMLRGIADGRRRVVFPWWMGLAARLVGLLPPHLSGRLLSVPPGKDGLAGER